MSFFMQVWNRFNRAILPSPLHGITSRNTLLLTVKGRKSGRLITLPVNYTQTGQAVRITSKPERQWWRNLKANQDVRIVLRGKTVMGKAHVFESREDVCREFALFLQPKLQMAKYYQVGLDEGGQLIPEDLQKSAENLVLVRIDLSDTAAE